MTKFSIEALNKRFDDKLIERMNAVPDQKYTLRFWQPIKETVLNAHTHGNLRDEVRKTFIRLCPYRDLVIEVRQETRIFPEKVLSFSDASKKSADEKARKASQENEQQKTA